MDVNKPCEGTDDKILKLVSESESVLFVSIVIFALLFVTSGWTICYYTLRFRSMHKKDKKRRNVFNAVKKALSKIPTRPIKLGDKEIDIECPVCIESYRAGDICRQLPCKHLFHKNCVDGWLVDHQSCPMCKSDILKACGLQPDAQTSHILFSGLDRQVGEEVNRQILNAELGSMVDNMGYQLDPQLSLNEEQYLSGLDRQIHDPFGLSLLQPHYIFSVDEIKNEVHGRMELSTLTAKSSMISNSLKEDISTKSPSSMYLRRFNRSKSQIIQAGQVKLKCAADMNRRSSFVPLAPIKFTLKTNMKSAIAGTNKRETSEKSNYLPNLSTKIIEALTLPNYIESNCKSTHHHRLSISDISSTTIHPKSRLINRHLSLWNISKRNPFYS